MHAMPNVPMETTAPAAGGRTFSCYTAPGVVFHSEEEMKEHYRSEWHRYNLKRKIAGLQPLTREAFEERMAREGERDALGSFAAGTSSAAPTGTRSQQRRAKREEKSAAKMAAAAKNPNSKAYHIAEMQKMDEEAYIQHKMETAPPFDHGSDLFSRHQSASLQENLAHMAKAHGFYVPYLDYCTDLEGLMGYLLEKVYVGNVALLTDKQFHSVEAVQAHMRDKCTCKFEVEGNEDEFENFYDMEALAAQSPLWQLVEESDGEDGEEGWEDDEEEEEGDKLDGVPEEEVEGGGEGDAAELSGESLEAVLDKTFERALELGLLSEAEHDAITDAIAEGARAERDVYDEWRLKLRRAEAAARRAAAAGRAETESVGSRAYRVRYRGGAALPRTRWEASQAITDGGTLAIGGKEVGHRALRVFYRQSYGGAATALAASNPQLHQLMLQYQEAGVLDGGRNMLASRPLAAGKSERSYAQIRTEAKKWMQQGMNNNTSGLGMKHYKNQSLTF